MLFLLFIWENNFLGSNYKILANLISFFSQCSKSSPISRTHIIILFYKFQQGLARSILPTSEPILFLKIIIQKTFELIQSILPMSISDTHYTQTTFLRYSFTWLDPKYHRIPFNFFRFLFKIINLSQFTFWNSFLISQRSQSFSNASATLVVPFKTSILNAFLFILSIIFFFLS
ncbi:transmembrane protein, putative (macronuclear) [Tetrahymena thermophila SB210]|uniref:Transmembrane protein, putative n=1 Tax=Tetrahymena thermophila (strain SB210) TaxID=312017 RepID=W7XHJ8_TETTS|nr:transmembrane protein, putative [Tetrahymena thermophila SB210]EWS73861.1 transmembrane protein, putative [Tetrahymena thermophila SB210]|eukprot:XP_012653608.1 transmembrane protein, putative [Tetrahymena thermophila SB210]